MVEPGFLSLSDDEAVAAKYSGTVDGKVAIIFELELGKASLGAELTWLSQFPHDSERLLLPRTHLQVVGGPTCRADGVTVVRVRPTVFQNVRTVEEVAGARKGEISAHIKGLVTDLRNAYFYPDVSKRDRADLDYVLDSGLAERLAAFEQHLLARFCKYEPEWYHDNGKYSSAFLGVLREVEDARLHIADSASALSRQLASASAGPKPGELSVGTTVEIHSLLRAPELNGVRGEIVGPPPQDPGTGRWSVKIEKEGPTPGVLTISDHPHELNYSQSLRNHCCDLCVTEIKKPHDGYRCSDGCDFAVCVKCAKAYIKEAAKRLVALKSSNLRLVFTPSLRGADKKVMDMQGVVRQMPNAVQELHSKFFQVCHSTTHARAHT